jgi:cell division protein ZapA
MPLVEVMVNGRPYQVGCDTGQEDRLRDLAELFDQRVQALVAAVGQVGDTRLMLMAGLMLADEISTAHTRFAEREREIQLLKGRVANGTDTLERAEIGVAELLEQAAIRIERIAARVAAS